MFEKRDYLTSVFADRSGTTAREKTKSGGTPDGNGGGVPAISLPKGGGAIRGIGEKFSANPVTGTGSFTVPLATSPGRSGFGPRLSLSYDSGAGNGPFGLGWNLSLPSITRKTDKGLPQYFDAQESDVFILSGAEDLVPIPDQSGTPHLRTVDNVTYEVKSYRPRIEGLFARIERWTESSGVMHWRSISRENITTLYGKTANSRIADPNDQKRIFSWLISESYDDKGNAIVYGYKQENDAGVDPSQANERNRTALSRSANRYPKSIKYGNRVSRLIQPDLTKQDWLFEVVFDYGEHDAAEPEPEKEKNLWLCRHDPFSVYRAGFEVRTYRLCQRVLMFHHFPAEAEIGRNCLVRSTDFTYSENGVDDQNKNYAVASFIASVVQNGYRRETSGYQKRSWPPIEFSYTEAVVNEEVQEADATTVVNLPSGLDGANYRWVDIDGDGISGILTEQADAWFYKPNLGGGRFGPLQKVTQIPSLVGITGGHQQLLDLAGDGQLDLVEFAGSTPGFYERTYDQNWERFKPFSNLPKIRWDEPNLRFVDLNGDGHADVLVTEQQALVWHASLGEGGFGPPRCVPQAGDEEQGPKLVFADGTQSIYLADMSGGGLTDLVRIRNGEVCYWPNLGYGRFGAKVTMDNSPWFDASDQFDQRRVRLADIDGSATNDIIYLGRDSVLLYFNQSGNRWSQPRVLDHFPQIDNLSSVMTADLLGQGTACLVWSSQLPSDARRPLRYIDLMGGQKPHLLVSMKNNLGAETHVTYAPATHFYLKDKAEGKPWITRLPFPVHVVERVETHDRISRNRFITRYAYHHGYFDGIEREFRGFGLVEQWDTEEFAALTASNAFPTGENIDVTSHVPPVLTRTWFHTGAWLEGGRISRQFEDDYYREGDESQNEPGLSPERLEAMLLDDTVLPNTILRPDETRDPWTLSAEEVAEACRALKGSILRQEIYGLDATEEEDRPYSVSERNYTIELLQPRGANKHAVFFVHPREMVDFHYERRLFVDANQKEVADPRVAHSVTLSVDAFGNVLQSVAIAYGRRRDDPDQLLTIDDHRKQKQMLITLTENQYTKAAQADDAHRTPLLCESRTYELYNVRPGANESDVTDLFRFDELSRKVQAASDSSHDLLYEDIEAAGVQTSDPYRRIIECARTLFRADKLDRVLNFKELEPRALQFETYKLAFTQGLLSKVFQRPRENQQPENLISDPNQVLHNEGGYVHLDGDGHYWWVPSGRVFFVSDPNANELTNAENHFFLPQRFEDPFGNSMLISYDQDDKGVAYDLLVSTTEDPAHNVVVASNDYRVLQPQMVTDPNGNRTAVAFDALGLVVGTAVMGKENEAVGDSLENFDPDLAKPTIRAYLTAPLKEQDAHDLLGNASTRLIYDLEQYLDTSGGNDPQPNVVVTLARETHHQDALQQGIETEIQRSFAYSDGLGREIQKKLRAEPGPLDPDDVNAHVVDPRWVGSGWTIFNNKGKPVRQYEPFFTDTVQFEFARAAGVSPILFYDPVERVVATLHPNHTYEKVAFDPWRQEAWDVNDTVLMNPKTDPDVGDFFLRLDDDTQFLPTWHMQRQQQGTSPEDKAAASKTEVHAGTPTVAFFDTLGRTFLTVAHNRYQRTQNNTTVPFDETHSTRVDLDIEGNQRAVIDALNRIVMRYDYDMLGNRMHQASMDAGERWMLNDVTGKPIRAWDSRGHQFTTEYDKLRRPLRQSVRGTDADQSDRRTLGSDLLFMKTEYGEGQQHDVDLNLRTRVFMQCDAAGIVTNEKYDFKGNLLRTTRELADEYKQIINWQNAQSAGETFTSSTTYDALNRPVTLTTPRQPKPSVIRLVYNVAGLLERIEANLRGELDNSSNPKWTSFVNDIDYDAKGQRERIKYGNGVTTTYKYDRQTFRLINLTTQRSGDRVELQNLTYTYDPAGNITHIRDDAAIQKGVFFRNQLVEPVSEYTYDAIYRLIGATGREHLGQNRPPPTPLSQSDIPRIGLQQQPGDDQALGRYFQQYSYDKVGNILEMNHQGTDPSNQGWTRTYTYAERSLLEPNSQMSNRLSKTTVGANNPFNETYFYDQVGGGRQHGFMTSIVQSLPMMLWDFKDQLQATQRQVRNDGGTPETTYYVYDANGQRVRKVTEGEANLNATPTHKKERIYLGAFEIYREYNGNGTNVTLERESLHIMDDKQRIALVETQTQGARSPNQLTRYQFSNHLGSATLELEANAQIISYEEYYPYGSTSYQAVDQSIKAAAKRYRYTGKERDEETGLYYHGARYYAPWIGRWTSADTSDADGVRLANGLYLYVRDNPIRLFDPDGHDDNESSAQANAKQKFRQAVGRRAEAFIKGVESATDNVKLRLAFYEQYSGTAPSLLMDMRVREPTPREKALNLYDRARLGHSEPRGSVKSPRGYTEINPNEFRAGLEKELGGLAFHELAHCARGATEGEAYGIEEFFAERNKQEPRRKEIADIKKDPVDLIRTQEPANTNTASRIAEDFKSDFNRTLQTLWLLQIIIMGQQPKEVPEMQGISVERAKELMAEVVTKSVNDRSRELKNIDKIVTEKRSAKIVAPHIPPREIP